MEGEERYGRIRPGGYPGKSVRDRIRAFFLDNIGKIVTGEQINEVARDPRTGQYRENWHQRLSELRTDEGYTILSWRNEGPLKVSEYMMPTADRRSTAAKRTRPIPSTWRQVLEQGYFACEWREPGGVPCGLREGEIDPVGGGTVRLTPDHKTPHALNPTTDPTDPEKWQALCGRHQVMKRNYWDDNTGRLNVYAIIQAASESEKRVVYEFLRQYFGEG